MRRIANRLRCPGRQQRLDHLSAQDRRQYTIRFEYALFGVAQVAPEQLVAPVTGQDSRNAVASREPRTTIRWQRRGVAEWLVEGRGELGHVANDIGGHHVVLVVVGCEVPRGDARIRHLVVALRCKADRVGLGGPSGDLAEHARHGRAVCAPAEECPDGSGVRLAFHCLADDGAKLRCELFERPVLRLDEAGRPVTDDPRLLAVVSHERMAGRQALDPREYRARRGDHVEVKIVE